VPAGALIQCRSVAPTLARPCRALFVATHSWALVACDAHVADLCGRRRDLDGPARPTIEIGHKACTVGPVGSRYLFNFSSDNSLTVCKCTNYMFIGAIVLSILWYRPRPHLHRDWARALALRRSRAQGLQGPGRWRFLLDQTQRSGRLKLRLSSSPGVESYGMRGWTAVGASKALS
jgi:hypothetical protein